MANYIEREALLEEVKKLQGSSFSTPLIIEQIEKAPTADVIEVKRGEWIKVRDGYPRYACSRCHHLYNNIGYTYCPNCGADMKRSKTND